MDQSPLRTPVPPTGAGRGPHRAHSGTPRPRLGRGVATAAAVASLILCAAACGDSDGESTTATPGTSAADRVLEPEVAVDPGTAPEVDLLDAGSGERRILAYGPSTEPHAVAVTRSGTTRTEVPGSQPRVDDTPEQVLTVEGRSEPDVDGAQRATVTVRDFTSVDELRAAQFATAPGFTVTWTRSADGVVRALGLAAPVDATDAARAGVEITANAISDATVVFPVEPLGVGARWTVTRWVDDAVAPTRVTTYELIALTGDVATVRLDITAPDPASTLSAPSPDGGPDVSLDVETYEVSGGGELTVDLRAALPLDGRTESSSRAVYVDPATGRRTTYDEDSELSFLSVD